MKRKLMIAWLTACTLLIATFEGQAYPFSIYLPDEVLRKAANQEALPISSPKKRTAFDFTKIGKQVVREFENAWSYAKAGTSPQEGLVLIFRMLDGSYRAREAGRTHEYKQVSFDWQPNAIAIVHTHPNSVNPKPSSEDREVADRLGVPIFTITSSGMFMYDPHSRKTTIVHIGLDWLNVAKWSPESLARVQEFGR